MKNLITGLVLTAMLAFGADKPIDMKIEDRVTILEQYTKILEQQRDMLVTQDTLRQKQAVIAQLAKTLDDYIASVKKKLDVDDSYELNDKIQFVKKPKKDTTK